jgi:hypothetical protein
MFWLSARPNISKFRHKLCHDTESVFWLLLYWFMRAQPAETNDDEDEDGGLNWWHWDNLTGGDDELDPRITFFYRLPSQIFHRDYQNFASLLYSMSKLLNGDPDVLDTDSQRKKDEYLLVAFQRLLLNFLFKHRDPKFTFMYNKKHREPREITRPRWVLRDPSSSTTNTRESGSLESQSGGTDSSVAQVEQSLSHKRRRDSDDQGSVPEEGEEPVRKKVS